MKRKQNKNSLCGSVYIFFAQFGLLNMKNKQKAVRGEKNEFKVHSEHSVQHTQRYNRPLLHSDLTSNVSNVCSHYMFRTLLSGHRCSDHTGPVCQRCVLVSFVLFANVTKVVIAMVNTLVLFD